MTAPPIPSTAADLREILGKPENLKAIAEDDGGWAGWAVKSGESIENRDKSISEQIAVEVQRQTIQAMKDAGGDGFLKRLNQSSPEYQEIAARYSSFKKGTAYNKAAPGAMLDAEFTGVADYLKAIWDKNPDPAAKAKLAGLKTKIQAAFGSTIPSDGGFLIPETLRSNLLQVALESAVVRPRATVIPMDSLRVPFPVLDSTTNVGSVFGGLIAYWTEEAATLTASSMKFGRIVLEAQKLTGFSALPNELMRDSIISMAALLEQKWPEALAFFEDLAFISGTGVGEPLGFLGNSAAIAVAKESGQPAATIVWENILDMYSRMLPSSLARGIWLYTPAAFKQLGTMALSVGTGGAPVWINNGQDGPPMRILGRPAMPCEKLAALGTQGDIVFVDLSYYLVGDRQIMQAESSEHYLFGSDQTAFRIIQRVDGRPWIQSAITPANSGPTLSPFVELATRA